MYDLLRSFTAVLDEFGVSHGRAQKAALCAAEGLMMVKVNHVPLLVHSHCFQAGPVFKGEPSINILELIGSIQSYKDSTSDPKTIIQPTVRLHSDSPNAENAHEVRG